VIAVETERPAQAGLGLASGVRLAARLGFVARTTCLRASTPLESAGCSSERAPPLHTRQAKVDELVAQLRRANSGLVSPDEKAGILKG
jgi:hypothetical protein